MHQLKIYKTDIILIKFTLSNALQKKWIIFKLTDRNYFKNTITFENCPPPHTKKTKKKHWLNEDENIYIPQ